MSYLNSIFNLQDKVAVITGGSGVIGSAIAKGLLMTGAKVVIMGTSDEKLNLKLDELKESGGREVIGLKCNVLDEENLKEINEKIIDKFKRIDILINAAGGNIPEATLRLDQNIFDMKIKDFNKVTDLNFNGTVLPILVFGKSMAAQKSGSIINISSMATQRAITRVAGYSAAKAAVDNFTMWLAVEVALKFGDGIRVNALAPGFLLTEQNKRLLTNEDGCLTERGERIIGLTPFKRFGDPDELIGPALWLASDASKFVTGTIIPVDGGFSAFSGI
jgi:NAD(P)-dependent dehydrogenase (short-subunit alcohol dehydrogenase family)